MKNVYTYLETGLNQFCNVTNTIPVLRGIGTVFVLLNQQNLSAPPPWAWSKYTTWSTCGDERKKIPCEVVGIVSWQAPIFDEVNWVEKVTWPGDVIISRLFCRNWRLKHAWLWVGDGGVLRIIKLGEFNRFEGEDALAVELDAREGLWALEAGREKRLKRWWDWLA